MTNRLRALRLVLVLGYLVTGLGVAIAVVGPYAVFALPAVAAFGEPVLNWATGSEESRRMRVDITASGRDALTSEQMDWSFKQGRSTVIDDDPAWGKLVEGRDTVWGQPLTAVQVTNSTPEPDGSYKKVWLRVPSRGQAQGTRVCMRAKCGKDIAWSPRTAKEAIAWGFRLCEKHYKPAKAS